MSKDYDGKSESYDGNIVMYRTVDWQSQIATIAGPYRQNETRESWLNRATRDSHSTFWHVRSLYYGELKDPKYSVAFKLLSAADRARQAEMRRDVEKATALYLTHAQRLQAIDPDFHREQIDVLVSAARIISERNHG